MTSSMENPEVLDEFLRNYDTTRFYIEYDRFLSNHLSHGVLALHRLGADRGRLEQFVDRYTKKLEAPDAETATNQSARGENQDGVPHPGTRHSYYKLLDHYKQKLETVHGGDLTKFVGSEFPALSPGLAGSALHGLIHLGHGFASRAENLVCEGFAYLHHSYLPITVPAGVDMKRLWEGQKNVLEVLDDVRADTELLRYVKAEDSRIYEQDNTTNYFENRLGILFTTKVEEVFKYATQVKLPDFVGDGHDLNSVRLLGRWILDCAFHVYARSERTNEFFLLHGVTGAWSLLQLLPALNEPCDVIGACATFFITLLAVYITEECPALNKGPASYRLQYRDWPEITEAALDKVCDEHIYKLVHIAKESSANYMDPKMLDVYKMAANIALTEGLSSPPKYLLISFSVII